MNTYYFNQDLKSFKSLGGVVFEAIQFIVNNGGKNFVDIKKDLEIDTTQKTAILKLNVDYEKLEQGKNGTDRYSKNFITDNENNNFYVSTQWGITGSDLNKWRSFIGYCTENNLEILNEREFKVLSKLKNIVDKINNSNDEKILTKPQLQPKMKSNICIKRSNDKLPTLWINVKTFDLSVGNKIELTGIFKNNNLTKIPFNGKKERQEYKYECPDEKIESVIHDYAEIKNQEKLNKINKNMNISKNQILYGPPGTGKTYSTVEKALEILGETDRKDIKSIGKLKEEFGSQVEFVTFHQSFSYEDFVEGLKAKTDDEKLSYEVEGGIFKEICESAENKVNIDYDKFLKNIGNEILTLTTNKNKSKFQVKAEGENLTLFTGANFTQNGKLNKDVILGNKTSENRVTYINSVYKYLVDNYSCEYIRKNYVLIIDEINRGNISRIFGELITLIEPSKRAGEGEAITLKLPYSKDDFSVPNNLYIIGTMNTADRSLTMMDTALRRRFDFVEMLPNHELPEISINCDGVNLQEMLKIINQRIEVLYDREHTIGHAFLMNIDDLKQLQNTFKNKILPLLEEYFYDDFEKIKAVLNDKDGNFYTEVIHGESLFNDFDIEYNNEQKIYKRNNKELKASGFINIYSSQQED
jgi:5-methylcytosine-specific restriction protein B